MLARAMQEIEKQGYQVVNVDSIVITEAPKIGLYREQIRKETARMLKIPAGAVQVKGKTKEGLDAIGEKKAIAAQAVVLLRKD
jgi:2-C-methyl-D-erythritol 2,4-cyclodiphosphate synthase